jgi:hypothetical protein
MIDALIAIGLVIVNAVFLATNLLALPGNWLMIVATVLVTWWRRDAGMFSVWTLVAVVAMAAAGEFMELLSGATVARRAGASRWGAFGAILGGVVGAIAGTFLIPVPVVGSLVGACGGAAAGAFILERLKGRPSDASLRAGVGAGWGHLLGTASKLLIGAAIWIVITIAAFWP